MDHFDKLCLAPWNSIYEGPKGVLSPCCQLPVSYESDDYDEAYLKWQHLRDQYDNQIVPIECENCPDSLRESFSLKLGNDKRYDIRYMDLLFSNKCNFACLGCKSSLSSTIGKLFREPFHIANEGDELSDRADEWSTFNKKKLDFIAKNASNIKSIHLNGGEPFLQDGIYELLDYLIKKKLNKKIHVWSHTNGSVDKYKGVDIVYDYLVHFNKASVVMSLDNFEKRGEYVRWGLNQKKWLKIYDKIQRSGLFLNVHSCYNVFNCLILDKFAEWFLDNNIKPVELKFWAHPQCYSVDIIKSDSDLLDKSLKQVQKIPKYFGWNKNIFYNLLNKEIDHSRLIRLREVFYESITLFDIKRNTDFLNTFPELKKMYSRI